jgi:hypothetical protein
MPPKINVAQALVCALGKFPTERGTKKIRLGIDSGSFTALRSHECERGTHECVRHILSSN